MHQIVFALPQTPRGKLYSAPSDSLSVLGKEWPPGEKCKGKDNEGKEGREGEVERKGVEERKGRGREGREWKGEKEGEVRGREGAEDECCLKLFRGPVYIRQPPLEEVIIYIVYLAFLCLTVSNFTHKQPSGSL